MEDKHIFYDYEGNTLKIPVSEKDNFEKDAPSAKMLLTYNGHNLAIPLSELKSFAKDVGKDNISYSVYNDKNEYVPEESTDKYLSFEGPSLGESVAKATGSAAIRTGKRGLNLLQVLSSGYLYNDPETGEAKRVEDIDTQLKDETNTFRNASILAGETADRLSREADPTGGQEGFVDLMAKGQIGKALQKGLVTTIESLPQTLSAYNPITMGLNAAAMAAENYVESTLENPEMEKWKRATYAIGTAAFEQAVEKFADPLFKYIGGGKAAKGLTEEAAKKLINDVTRQATDDMAKRIFAGLGKIGVNVLKDAGGEGLEEVITSFGNDALGEALDAIDGDKDFGIRAQWQKMKAENPDADMWDFAKAKAKEYADAFIGGALSGGIMSGPTQLLTGGADMIHKEVAIRTIENSREFGSGLDLQNSYDVNEKVKEVTNNAIEAFKEEGKPAISDEFFAGLTSDEAFALSESEDITPAQRAALENIASVKAMEEGLNEKLDNRINEKINSLAAIANDASENGTIFLANHNGNAVFVKGATVNENGTVTLPDGSEGPVIIVNETTGEKTTVPSKEIQKAIPMNTEEYNSNIANAWRTYDKNVRDTARNTMSQVAKMVAVKPYAGKKILVDLGNGPVEVYVQQITENGEVTLKGKKGDLGGQSIITLNAGTFYDSIHRDGDGNPVITEVKEGEVVGEVEEQPTEPETQTETPEPTGVTPNGQQDYREQTITIMINGKPVEVEVTGQDNTADRITYEYTDENGNRRSGGSSIAEFEAAITTPVETEPVVEPETPAEEPVAEAEPEAPAEVPVTPEAINWDALLENEPETYFAEMQKRFGDKTANRINAVITVLQKEIDSLNKANPKTQEEIFENEDRKEALQAKIDSLNGMIERLNAPAETAPEVTTEPVAETPVDEAPVAETEPVVETPVAEEPVTEEEPVTPPTEEAPVEEQPVAEQPVVEQTPEPAPVVPVAPNPVANPVDMALEEEKKLRAKLERTDMNRNEKRDWAYKYGKKIADMFATRDDYAAYEAVAESLGAFDADFERGVDESFANRQNNNRNSQQDKSNAQKPSTLNRIEDTAVTPTDTQKEVGKFVIQWLRDAGYAVHTDITELLNAIKRSEKEKTQFLKTADGEVYGLMQNGEIYLDMSLLNPNTPIHEYTHIWDAIIMEQNPQLWEEGKKLLKQLPLWNEIANSKRYKNLQGDENLIASEVHSRLVGEKGEAVFTQLYERANGHINEIGVELDLITKIKNWIYQVMDNLKSIIIPYGRDKSVSLQEFIAMPLNDLVFNAKPRNRFTETNKLYWGEQPANALSNLSTIAVDNIDKFNSHAQQYYTELKYGIGYVVYEGSVYVFDIDSDGLARPVIESTSYEKARRKIDVFNRINSSGFDTQIRTEGDRTADDIHNNSGNGVRGTSENVSPVADGESRGDNAIKVGGENSVSKNSVSGSSVESDGLLFRSSSIDEEMEAIKNEAIANGTFMKAPNGKPTKLNERQWLQVRTQNFLNWFGDWINDPKNASKVVDENGEPMVVYHGSPYGNITEFNRKGHSVSGLREFGTYFGSNRRLAELYAYARQQAKGDVEKYELEKAKIDAIIFDPETPPRVALDAFDELDKLNESQKPKVYEVFLNIRNPKEFDAEKNNGYKGWHKLKQDVGYDIKTGVEAVEAIAGHNSAARMSEKYDGIIAHNMADVHHEEGLDELMGDVFLVFDETPSHIKSATNNTGEFSIENPDIRARRGTNNDNFVKQFEFKQNNERGQLEYSDEFRGLQEESARMSEQLVSEKDGVQRAAIRGLVERIGGTLQRELDRAISGRGYKLRNVVNESKGTSFDIIENVDGRLFHDIFAIVRAYLPNGELVDLHDNYDRAICYITSDGLAGFAVDADGNLISVYSLYGASKKGFLGAIKDLITEAGATHLDGYNSQLQPLAEIYSKVFGWKVASMMDYNMDYDHDNIAQNHSMPQVAFMVNTNEDIETKHFDKDQYDEAEGYQKEQVENSQRTEAQNAAIDYTAGDARVKAIENAVNEEAAKLGVKVTYKTREQMPKGHKNDKGYYNTKTGEIVICSENATDVADAIKTILHEAVAHKGLRKLMGDKFNEFINRVYNSLDAETKARVDALATANYNGDKAVAMEEYMATLAESENFAENSVWDKIKSIFTNIINAILGRNDIKIGDNELRYILRASYNNMVNPRGMESVAGWAQDQLMREEYGVNETAETPELLSRTGVDPTEVAATSARQVYEKMVSDDWNEFQRQFQDAYQPVRVAIDAIQQETGNIPIEDYENYLLIQNQSSSRSRVEIDTFSRRFYSPIIDQTNKIISQILKSRNLDVEDKNNRAEVYKEVLHYLIAKHGLERNEYYQKNKKRLMTAAEQKPLLDEVRKEYEEKANQINSDTTLTEAERKLQLREAADEYDALVTDIKTREVPDMRDYSGLTALYGLKAEDFKKAEDEAKKEIAKFESLVKTDDLWSKINAATNRTLKHSYESGMISRKQYEEISKMFNFYIPLRGFDENTAEDVYSYARFEGNRFNPAVQKVKGRTSLADDPIATIMNMAESEIAQGNKNKAKQALYNYILNRPVVGPDGKQRQNSLMQIESVWYTVSTDENGNKVHQIAVPDHASGETYEAFENKMQAMAADGKAYKSKKGGVDVGMRFQKPANRDAHYVYLKINGVEKAIYINGDPKAADAINGTYKQKPLPKAKIKIGDREITVDLAAIQRNISSTFTNYSLEFTARNFVRDMFYSHINMDIKESNPEYRKKFRQNWRHNMFNMLSMLKAYRAGEYDTRELNEDEAAFVEFMENGGQTGYTVINSVEARKTELENAIKRMQDGVEKGGLKDSSFFKFAFGGIELLNEASELVTRFAAYKTSRDMGRSVVRSISDAKEITVNFNTKGAQDGTGVFGKVAQYFGWSKYFFNASVQGVQNITAMAKADKLKFCTTVGTIMATGFMMPVIISAISAMLGGDDEEEYWNIPEYDRQNNFCIPIGGTYLKLPLPIGFREMYAIGDMVAAMAFDKKFARDAQQVGMDMANKIASIVLPINPLEGSVNGLNIWASMGTILAPSSAQFLIQNATNTDWKGAPLQKEYTYNENDPQWMKAYASNPLWMKSLSKWCNETIGTGDMKGADWSPEKLDNTLSNLLGGVYTLVKKAGKTFSMLWNEDNRKISNVPLAGVILGAGINSDDAFVTDAYFEMKEYYDERITFIKKRAEKFGYNLDEVFLKEKGKHHPKMQDIYLNKEFDFMQEWYKGNDELKELQKKVKELEKEIASKENPSEVLVQKLLMAKAKLENERREFVNDMLELD